MTGKFLKDVHNLAYFTGTNKPVNSVMDESGALYASACISASGTTYKQQGRLPLRIAHVSGISAAMIPANQLEPTGWTNLFGILLVGTPDSHIVGLDPEYASAQIASGKWIPKNDPF